MAACVGQTFLSASWGDFPVAPRPDWKVRRTGRLESLLHLVWRGIPDLNFGIEVKNIPDDLYCQLKETAEQHRRSLNRQVIVCLERSLQIPRVDAGSILSRARELRLKTLRPLPRVGRSSALAIGIHERSDTMHSPGNSVIG